MERTYRKRIAADGLLGFAVAYKQTDLFVETCRNLEFEVFEVIRKHRQLLENYIAQHKAFLSALEPVEIKKNAPRIVRIMAEAAKKASVGPMAAVAGAFAEIVGEFILKECSECVVENGGDVFLKLNREPVVKLYTTNPFFKDKLHIRLEKSQKPYGICSSSAKIGPSLSFGKADLATIVGFDVAFCDALATKTANMIKTEGDIEKAIEFASKKDIVGCVFIKDKSIGVWGNLELV